MDRVIIDIEAHINSTMNRLAGTPNPRIDMEKLENITEDIKDRLGFITIEEEIQMSDGDIMLEIDAWSRNSECIGDRYFGISVEAMNMIFDYLGASASFIDKNGQMFNSMNMALLNFITTQKTELVNHQSRITNHLRSVNIFFERFMYSLKESKVKFIQRKDDMVEKENSIHRVLFLPFSFTIVFALLSIITNFFMAN